MVLRYNDHAVFLEQQEELAYLEETPVDYFEFDLALSPLGIELETDSFDYL